MFPATDRHRRPIEGADLIPEGIRRSYNHVLTTYNAQAWPAAAVLCRRTLEGLAAGVLGPGRQRSSLASMLREIAQRPDLGRPIAELADSVREGGNLGAHFDETFDPDEELARTMLNLLEYLLEYFYTLPQLITQAREVLERPRPANPPA